MHGERLGQLPRLRTLFMPRAPGLRLPASGQNKKAKGIQVAEKKQRQEEEKKRQEEATKKRTDALPRKRREAPEVGSGTIRGFLAALKGCETSTARLQRLHPKVDLHMREAQ